MTLTQSSEPASIPSPPPLAASIGERVETHLTELFDRESQRWIEIDPEFAAPLASLRRFVTQGGKRLRPAFCHWGFVAVGGDTHDAVERHRVEQVGAAFELLHAFALIHDDVMDDAPLRRGTPTVHVEYHDEHERGDWRGESRRFGESIAILLGDLAHVYADAMIEQAELSPHAQAIWRELQAELMMGQYLDVIGTARADRSPTRARLISTLKSGRYTVERPLQIGAALAHADRGQQRSLNAYAAPLGEAFQLRDDVLGAFGQPDTVGKPVGGDLREGKPTPLLALATERGTARQRNQLERVGTPGLSDHEIDAIQYILVATGALVAINERIADLVGESVDAINNVDISNEARAALVDLAHFISDREH